MPIYCREDLKTKALEVVFDQCKEGGGKKEKIVLNK
jgi:hypothetical protein